MENKVFLIYYLDKSYDVVIAIDINSALDKVANTVISKGISRCECIPQNVVM